MIRSFRSKKDNGSVLECIRTNNNSYFTFQDQDILNSNVLKSILNRSFFVTCDESEDEIKGIILIHKENNRNEVKFSCKEENIYDLLTVLLWSCGKELYVTLNKGSYLIDMFRYKGFKFFGSDNRKIILRKPECFIPKGYAKDFDEDED